jgi:hypothetical protein
MDGRFGWSTRSTDVQNERRSWWVELMISPPLKADIHGFGLLGLSIEYTQHGSALKSIAECIKSHFIASLP